MISVRYAADGWGVGELWLDGATLVHHELPRLGLELDLVAESHKVPLGDRLAAYFAGAREEFGDVEVELDGCTPFQLAVTAALRAIPYGETVTYGELAALAGHPNAQRAAGSFCAGNRFPVVVPCHRVVAANGLGSYGSLGLDYKRRMLELEAAS